MGKRQRTVCTHDEDDELERDERAFERTLMPEFDNQPERENQQQQQQQQQQQVDRTNHVRRETEEVGEETNGEENMEREEEEEQDMEDMELLLQQIHQHREEHSQSQSQSQSQAKREEEEHNSNTAPEHSSVSHITIHSQSEEQNTDQSFDRSIRVSPVLVREHISIHSSNDSVQGHLESITHAQPQVVQQVNEVIDVDDLSSSMEETEDAKIRRLSCTGYIRTSLMQECIDILLHNEADFGCIPVDISIEIQKEFKSEKVLADSLRIFHTQVNHGKVRFIHLVHAFQHWTLCEWDISRNIFAVYDSLPSLISFTDTQHVYHKLITFLIEMTPQQSIIIPTIRHISCPKQLGCDCGPHCIRNLVHILHPGTVPSILPGSDLGQMRRAMENTLYNQRKEPILRCAQAVVTHQDTTPSSKARSEIPQDSPRTPRTPRKSIVDALLEGEASFARGVAMTSQPVSQLSFSQEPTQTTIHRSQERSANKSANNHVFQYMNYAPIFTPQLDALDRTAPIRIYADGACRGNGKKSTSSSAGVYVHSFNSGMSGGIRIDEDTNNKAEIVSLSLALSVALLLQQQGFTNITICMDSGYCIIQIQTGKYLHSKNSKVYTTRNEPIVNNDLWYRVQEQMLLLLKPVQFKWVPRSANVCADECANCALDQRLPNVLLENTMVPESCLTAEILDKCIIAMTKKLSIKFRNIPSALNNLFFDAFATLANAYTPELRSRIFVVFPSVVAVYGNSMRGTDAFKETQMHFHLLKGQLYFEEALNVLLAKLQDPTPVVRIESKPTKEEEIRRCAMLAKNGHLADILRDNKTSYIDCSKNAADDLEQYFQQGILPDKLFCESSTPAHIYADVLRAFQRLKRGKSPALSGWNREILYILVKRAETDSGLRHIVMYIINELLSPKIPESISILLRTATIHVMRYREAEKKHKKRPISVFDGITKLLWNISLIDVVDDNFARSGNTMGLKNACQAALFSLQHCLDNDIPLLKCDAANAFPSLSRNPIICYLKANERIYGGMFNMFNLFYCQPVFACHFFEGLVNKIYIISHGVFQGCVSAPMLYAVGTLKIALRYAKSFVQVADDINITNIDHTDQIVAEFANLGQKLLGPKTMLLCKTGNLADISTTSTTMSNFQITNQPQKTLGGFLIPNREIVSQETINEALESVVQKVKRKHDLLIKCPASRQIRFLILRSMQWDTLYYAQVFDPMFSKPFFGKVEEITNSAFTSITTIPLTHPDHATHTYTPLECGGVGMVPWTEVAEFVHNRSQIASHHSCKLRSFPCPTQQQDPIYTFPNVPSMWMSLFKESLVGPRRTTSLTFADRMFLKNDKFSSWIRCLPTKEDFILTDEQFITTIQIRYTELPTVDYVCPLSKIKLESLSVAAFTNHFLSCSHCAGCHFFMRHQEVLFKIKRMCNIHGIYTSLPRSGEYPLPNNSRGGCDFILMHNSAIFAGDVKVTKNNTDGIYNRCLNNYKQFEATTGMVCAPFVINVFGVINVRTMELIVNWSKKATSKAGFINDMVMATQFALHRAHHAGHILLAAKALTQTAEQQQAILESFTAEDAAQEEEENEELA